MAIRKTAKAKKNPLQLELNFKLSTGTVKTKSTQLQFDFFNIENNFYAQLYKNRSKLKVDILRLVIADKMSKSRKPVKRMVLFLKEETRKKIVYENVATFKKYGIETATILVK